jgi:hypothetical protein
MVRSGLQTVDAQAKLAQSLGTTVASIQTLERAGELAGVSMSGIEQATKDLTRRLSQAAAGTGPAADALDRLGLSASELIALPLDQRVGAINAAIESFVPARRTRRRRGPALRRGRLHRHVAGSTPRRCARRRRTSLAFGVVVSEQDADQIERTNDAISRLGLIWRGLSQPAGPPPRPPRWKPVADAMAAVASRTGRSASPSADSSTTSPASQPMPPPSRPSSQAAGSQGWPPQRSPSAASPRRSSSCAAH